MGAPETAPVWRTQSEPVFLAVRATLAHNPNLM
jgi:hypothetical protein